MNLRQSRICVQRFHADERRHMQHAINMAQSEVQRAIFQKDSLWDIGTTITISFIDTDSPPQWYSINLIQQEAKQVGEVVDPLEYEVRNMHPIDAIQRIVHERVAPEVPGLQLVFVDTEGMLRVRLFEGGGSSSLIGTQSLSAPLDEHTITFGWLDVATIVHEFSHALGMLHEHQNPSGGIQWNKPVVYAWAEETQGWDKDVTDRNIIDTYATNQINGSVFDPQSIMLYFFPANFTLNNIGTKQNLHYSKTDKQWLNSMYPANGPRQLGPLQLVKDQPVKMASYWPWIILVFAFIFLLLVYIFWMARQKRFKY